MVLVSAHLHKSRTVGLLLALPAFSSNLGFDLLALLLLVVGHLSSVF